MCNVLLFDSFDDHITRVFVSKSYKGEMGNGVRENPKISLESPQNFPTFGVEFEFRSAP